MGYDGLGYGAGSMRSVFACRRQAMLVLVQIDCRRRSTVIKSTILPSTSVVRRVEIAKGTVQHN